MTPTVKKIVEYINEHPDEYLWIPTEEDEKIFCALEGDNIWMITAYYPSKNEWSNDLRTRRR